MNILELTLPILKLVMASDEMKKLEDEILDAIEDFIADSETKIDDVLIGGAIKGIRAAFNIPDGND